MDVSFLSMMLRDCESGAAHFFRGGNLSVLMVEGAGIISVLCQQFFVGAPFDDAAVVQDKDQIRVLDGRDPVGDHEDGALTV